MDDIENWYEKIVFEKIRQLAAEEADSEDRFDESRWSDVACLTLNHLPPRYVRHSVDMTFYLSPQEQGEMDDRVNKAIHNAVSYVSKHPFTTDRTAA
ncbi:MAG: competence protein ComFB [Candidatus Azotimanducaceae bacterium]|jgi:competence protein ComFB